LATDVLPLLEDPLPTIRILACDTLARLGSKRVLGSVIGHLSDENALAADEAQETLERP
jgi:hypothetical protein